MRTLKDVIVLDNFKLFIEFSNGEKKTVDLNSYLQLPAFEPIKQKHHFNNLTNKKYYIVWDPFDIDLSADTLWHEGR